MSSAANTETLSIVVFSLEAQIPFELGLVIERPLGYFVVPLTIVEVFRHITETNICALIVSIISIAFLVTIKVHYRNRKYDDDDERIYFNVA